MEDKRRDLRMLAAACAAALLVVAVLVLLFLSGRSGRKHDEIVLPESRPAQEQEDTPREEESVLTVTADFEFFRCAGHDADNKYIFRINAHLFSVPGLGYCTKHLLRRLAR